MTRDKQLQVRLESDVREKFKELCQKHDLEMSAFLYSLICHFVEGSIPIESFLKPTDSALHSEGIADLKKSILAELSGMVEGQVSKAIANLTPAETVVSETVSPTKTTVNHATNAPLTQAETVGSVTVTLPKTNSSQSDIIQGDLLGEDETAIEPSDINIPHWLIPNREYEQKDFAAAIGCDDGTITKVFNGTTKKPKKADLESLLLLKQQNRLTLTKGGKWIYKLS